MEGDSSEKPFFPKEVKKKVAMTFENSRLFRLRQQQSPHARTEGWREAGVHICVPHEPPHAVGEAAHELAPLSPGLS